MGSQSIPKAKSHTEAILPVEGAHHPSVQCRPLLLPCLHLAPKCQSPSPALSSETTRKLFSEVHCCLTNQHSQYGALQYSCLEFLECCNNLTDEEIKAWGWGRICPKKVKETGFELRSAKEPALPC